jgi:hypothetical protein
MPSHVFFAPPRHKNLLVQFNTNADLGLYSAKSTRRRINLLWIKIGISPRSVSLYYGTRYCFQAIKLCTSMPDGVSHT